MKMLLVVFIVLINYNEFSHQLPTMTNPRVKTMTINIGDIDVHVHAGAGLESHHGEEGHHGESAGIYTSDNFFNIFFFYSQSTMNF